MAVNQKQFANFYVRCERYLGDLMPPTPQKIIDLFFFTILYMNWASSETTVMRFGPFRSISSEDITVVVSSVYHVADMWPVTCSNFTKMNK